MSPGAVDRRLRQVASLTLAAARRPQHAVEQRNGPGAVLQPGREPGVSMSAQAVDRRLREAADLLTLCLELGRAKKLGR